MAESPSSALSGGVEWLPALGGAHLLRAEVRGEPPALVLHTAEGEEHRLDPGPPARFDGTTDYLVPAGLSWSRATLVWPDGTRAVLPSQADVIALPRRDPVERSLPRPLEPLPWTAPPWSGGSDTEVATATWAARRATFEQELAHAADAVARVAESERETREAVLAIVASTQADLQAARAAQAAEASLLTGIAEELDAERAAHEATRGSIAEELDAERRAHAETRESVQTLAEALAAARAELEAARDSAGEAATLETVRAELAAARAQAENGADARAHLASARRDAALARAEVATLRADLEAERAARARAEAALHEAGDGTAYLERVAKLDRDVAGLRTQVRLERRAREQAEAAAAAARRPPEQTGRLLADLDAAAAALRAATEPHGPVPAPPTAVGPPAPAASPGAWLPAAAASPGAAWLPAAGAASPAAAAASPGAAWSPAAGAASPAAVAASAATARAVVSSSPTMYRAAAAARAEPGATVQDRCLRLALVGLAAEDPVAAGTLLTGLLPAQGAVIDDTLTYDLTVRGIGTFAVFVADGAVRVQRTSRPRGRAAAAFHLAADPLALAELLAGDAHKVRRFGRAARYSGRRKRLRRLAALPEARLSLADAVRAGARLEPWLVYRALPFAIPPEWTRGHVFTIAQEIVELAPRAWYITARDGVPLRVIEYASGAAADATVTMTRAAFDRLLRGEPMVEGERPVVRGDVAAVNALRRWTDLARGG